MPRPSIRFVCLALAFPVILLSICLVPVGHGSFCAAYGPTATFRAFRSLLLLMSIVTAAISARVAQGLTSLLASIDPQISRRTLADITSHLLVGKSPLRC